MTDISRKTLTIAKRGRKYFECTLGRAKAQLVISDLTPTWKWVRWWKSRFWI